MAKWNEEAAPNLNLRAADILSSHLIPREKGHEYSEELSEEGERNIIIERQSERPKMETEQTKRIGKRYTT